MVEKDTGILERYTEPLSRRIQEEYAIGPQFYQGEVKKGLRNSDGTGVLVGVTKVGSVQGSCCRTDSASLPRAACTTAASSLPTSWRPTAEPAPSAMRRWRTCW